MGKEEEVAKNSKRHRIFMRADSICWRIDLAIALLTATGEALLFLPFLLQAFRGEFGTEGAIGVAPIVGALGIMSVRETFAEFAHSKFVNIRTLMLSEYIDAKGSGNYRYFGNVLGENQEVMFRELWRPQSWHALNWWMIVVSSSLGYFICMYVEMLLEPVALAGLVLFGVSLALWLVRWSFLRWISGFLVYGPYLRREPMEKFIPEWLVHPAMFREKRKDRRYLLLRSPQFFRLVRPFRPAI